MFRFPLKAVLVVSVGLFLGLGGCGDDDSSPTGPGNNNNNNNNTTEGGGTLTATVNGQAQTWSVVTAVWSQTVIDALLITAASPSGNTHDTLTIMITDPAEGAVGDSSLGLSTYEHTDAESGIRELYWVMDGSSANISSLSTTGASGSFTFAMDTCIISLGCTSKPASLNGTFDVTFPQY